MSGFLDAAAVAPAALLLTGEQGIGKSTVWRHGLELGGARGFTVLVSRPTEAEVELPYAGLGDLLASIEDRDLASLPAGQRQALEVALLRAELPPSPLAQRAVGAGLLAMLIRLAERRPVLLAIDDAQWLDQPTARVLRFALRRVGLAPISALVAARTDSPAYDPLDLRASLAEDCVWSAHLSAMTASDTDQLLRSRLGIALPAATGRRVAQVSAGNPLFALELGRAIVRQGPTGGLGSALPVPDSLRELVLERLYRLPGTARDVLLAAAALSRPTVELVRAATHGGPRTEAAISRTLQSGVLETDGEVLRFSHPLLASALYTDTRPDARRRLHRRLAGVVTDPDERAQHLALASSGPDEAVADALEQAARRAQARGAPDAAATLSEQAAQMTPADQFAAATRRTLAAGVNWLEAGDVSRAAALLEPLAGSLPAGADRARVLLGLGRVRTADQGLQSAVPVLLAALDEADSRPELQAAIERDLTVATAQTTDLRLAESHARNALSLAEEASSPALVAAGLAQLASVEFLLGRGIRGELLERAAAIEASATDPYAAGLVPTDLMWGALLKWSDQFDGARERFDAIRRRAIESGDETNWVSLLFQVAELELWAGDWARAEALAVQQQLAAERQPPQMQPESAYLAAALSAYRGELEAARTAADVALEQARRTADLRFTIRAHALLGFIELSAGRPADALPNLRRAHDLFESASYDDPGVIRFMPELVEALLASGDLAAAERHTEWLLERGRTLARPYALAAGKRCRAIVLSAQGQTAAALVAVEEALQHHAALALPFELARTLLVKGSLLRRHKARRDARVALVESVALFDQLGAAVWAERARAEMGRIGGRAPATMALTPTETQVARLAADGYGNQQIADALFIGVKTVEGHLTHVYDKLGVRSRGELSRRARSGDIPDFSGDRPA